MTYKPTLLRSTEHLMALHAAKWEPQMGHEIVHIKVRAEKERGGLRHGMWMDVMACGRKGVGRKLPGVPDANRASCRRCLEKYQPKRGEPPVKGTTP